MSNPREFNKDMISEPEASDEPANLREPTNGEGTREPTNSEGVREPTNEG